MKKIEQDKEPLSDYEIEVKLNLSHDPRKPLYINLDLEEALRILPKKQRRCFELVVMEGYTEREVAKKLSIAHQSVNEVVGKAKEKIRNFLQGACQKPRKCTIPMRGRS